MSDSSFSLFQDKNYVDITLYQFGWEHCAPLHSYGPAMRNHYLFHYIISGKGHLTSTASNGTDSEYDLHNGQGFLICPGQRNTYMADEKNPWEYTWLEFDGLKAKEFIDLSGLNFDAPVYNSCNPDAQQIMKDEMLYIADHGSESALNLIGHLYLFMDALIKSSDLHKVMMEGELKNLYAHEAINFIERNYQNPITIEDIAAFCNLNRSYFGKLFKSVMSATPQEFLIRYRMTKACDFLVGTRLPISEISSRVGYPNQLHFSRAFKNVYGVSPREWRASHIRA